MVLKTEIFGASLWSKTKVSIASNHFGDRDDQPQKNTPATAERHSFIQFHLSRNSVNRDADLCIKLAFKMPAKKLCQPPAAVLGSAKLSEVARSQLKSGDLKIASAGSGSKSESPKTPDAENTYNWFSAVAALVQLSSDLKPQARSVFQSHGRACR